MKTIIKSTIALAVVLFMASCEDDVKQTYQKKATFNISLENSSSDLSLFDTVDFSADYRMYITTFKAYLSNITLLSADGAETIIKDVELVNLQNDETSSFTLDLPSGNFTKVRVGLGLNPQQNDSDPNSFPNANPLSSFNGMYWNMLKYRFVVFEGLALSKKDTVNIPFTYHTGTDPLYQVKTFDTDVNTSGSALGYQLNFKIDINTIFNGPAGKIDIATQSFTHSEGSSLAVAATFMENFKAAIQLNTSATLE